MRCTKPQRPSGGPLNVKEVDPKKLKKMQAEAEKESKGKDKKDKGTVWSVLMCRIVLEVGATTVIA